MQTADGAQYECRARGVLRKQRITPLVGDFVDFSLNSDGINTVDAVHERKNFLTRPPVANVDRLFIVVSSCRPAPNVLLIDKMTAIAVNNSIEPIVVITKNDVLPQTELCKAYKAAGIKSVCVSSVTGEGVETVAGWLKGVTSAFTGNSGVGKSTLLNALDGNLALQTGEISEKLGRGRHTTRCVELFSVCGGLVADTPGFSAVDMEKNLPLTVDKLPECFPEFAPYKENCRFFPSCTHTVDKGCAVIEAVGEGKIPASRHESYKTLYNELKGLKKWEL